MPLPRRSIFCTRLISSQRPVLHLQLRGFSAGRQLREEPKPSGPKISANYTRNAVPRSNSQLPVLPIIGILLLGSGLFYLLLKQREGQSKQQYQMPERISESPRKSSS